MAARFRASLTPLRGEGTEIRAAAFGLHEGYSTGWSGTAVVVGNGGATPLPAGAFMGSIMASGVRAGIAMSLNLMASGGVVDGRKVRTWPCVVKGLRPYAIDKFKAACDVHLVDPVGFLAEQPVWGAYRYVSAAEAIGGALSMAAGHDGKPTLTPTLPGLPTLQVVADYRDALTNIPYVVLAGQPLGDWLADFLGMIGLRAELRGTRNSDDLSLVLSDATPRRTPLEMSVVTSSGTDPASSDSVGVIEIHGHTAFPGARLRPGLMDDPTKGTPRPLIAYGAVGAVLTDAELDVDEASKRLYQPVKGHYSEMFTLTAVSRQPRVRPGETIRLSRDVYGLTNWQVSSVSHWLRSSVYDNEATLILGDLSWHPELPPSRPPVYVTAVVDGGRDFELHEPVPRDRLGRIKVVFPFTPTPIGEAAVDVAAADTNRDYRVTLDDFTDDERTGYTDNATEWEDKLDKYDAGDYDDPFPDKADSDLTEEEKTEREDLETKRLEAMKYRAYQRADAFDAQDADQDGVLSARDTLVSKELEAALRDDAKLAELQEEWDARDETPLTEDSLAQEYGELFGDDTEELSEEILAARRDAAEMADHWPPRLLLPMIKPMAGALHGFITAHRHGDTCRVAVHSPLSAEIVGFHYRDDRRINADLNGSVAGLVVEHNYADAWSGLVFRRTEDLETLPSVTAATAAEATDTTDEASPAETAPPPAPGSDPGATEPGYTPPTETPGGGGDPREPQPGGPPDFGPPSTSDPQPDDGQDNPFLGGGTPGDQPPGEQPPGEQPGYQEQDPAQDQPGPDQDAPAETSEPPAETSGPPAETPGTPPDIPGQSPDIPGQSPDIPGQSPDIPGQSPDIPGQGGGGGFPR